MPDQVRLPDPTQHVAIAGRTGSGKTVAGLNMLSQMDMDSMAWIVVDHKRDTNIKRLPAEPFNVNAMILPSRGLHVLYADMTSTFREDFESLLTRVFNRGKIGIYIDEGHLLGQSEMVRNILVAGRSKRVPLFWTSQRAHWIDSFIWSQASFYRCFQLQTKHDIKRFSENFPMRWKDPGEYCSWYYDVSKGTTYRLNPSPPIDATIEALDNKVRTQYRAI
jgi:hypothetical protein